MSTSMRLLMVFAVSALLAGWVGLGRKNAELEAQLAARVTEAAP